jgi:hypothetical protein
VLQAGVAQVPQFNGLFTRLMVRQNVLLGAYVIRRKRKHVEARYDALAQAFPVLAIRVAKSWPLSSVIPWGRALAEARPDRLVWGSDWPHLPNGQRDTGGTAEPPRRVGAHGRSPQADPGGQPQPPLLLVSAVPRPTSPFHLGAAA